MAPVKRSTSLSPSASPGPQSPASTPRKKHKSHAKPRVWTTDEDAILVALLRDVAKECIWSKVKEDGRLEYRCTPGIMSRVNALYNKLAKVSDAQ